MKLEEIDTALVMVFKKKLKKLQEFKGQGTQLISLYLPEDVDRSSVMNQLTEEISQSSNIKSPQTRKNVQGALRKIINFLKHINFKLPKHGLVVFAGNIAEAGRSDIILQTINPIKDLRTKLYWCDSEFHLAPLKEMITPSDVYALITMDKREATIASLIGKKYEIVGHYTSNVAGKTRAGGQCLSPDSLVQLSNGEILQIKNLHNPLTLSSFDFSENKLSHSKIVDKWENKKQLIKIITKKPRTELNCSPDHLFYVFEDNKVIEKSAKELKFNNKLLMPEKIKTEAEKILLKSKQYFNSFILTSKGRKKLINARKINNLSQKQLANKTQLTQTAISSIELGKRNSRKNVIKKICNSLEINFLNFIKQNCKENSTLNLPKAIDEKLAKIVGYFLGDGNFEKERINFSEQSKEVIKKYAELIKKYFNCNTSLKFRKNKGYYSLRVYGKPIVELLKNEFPELKKSKDSLIPSKILKCNNTILANFLNGLFDAEGFISKKRIGFAANNKLLVQQIQLALLRFGIIASLHEYNNRANKYSKNHRFSIDIAEKESIKIFKQNIGFTNSQKQFNLEKAIKSKSNKSLVRQIVFNGSNIRKIIEKHGYNLQLFPKVTNFFRNERNMGKEIFKNSILNYVKDKKLFNELKKIYQYPLIPVKVHSIEKTNIQTKMVDISVQNQSFVSNGLLVHNSSQRFERLREEAAHDFYKRVSERMNEIFVPVEEKLKGAIIGGPGMTKNHFLERELLDHRIKKKIIGILDASYTDESGIRELIQKSEELLRDTELMKERTIINKFLEEIAKNGLAAYGQKEVEEALLIGKVSTLVLSEALTWSVFRVECESCNKIEDIIVKEIEKFESNKIKCSSCSSSQIEVLEEIDYVDFMLEKAQKISAETIIVSTDTDEGEQFFKGFGGIGAILRYK